MSQPVDLAAALSQLDEPWLPRTVAMLNDYDVRIVKTEGEFTRHTHPETDEFFLVVKGSLTLRLDAGDVTLDAGQLYVVPRGIPHQPVSVEGAEVVLIEPSTTVNTGDTPNPLTAERRVVQPTGILSPAPGAVRPGPQQVDCGSVMRRGTLRGAVASSGTSPARTGRRRE